MGWSSATDHFDVVTKIVLEGDKNLNSDLSIRILSELAYSLQSSDWDTECESKYWEHPVIGKILGNDFEEEE